MKIAGPLSWLALACTAAVAARAQAVGPELKPVDFNQLDKNHDGKVSLLEARAVPDLEMVFDSLDLNHDGNLSLEEFQAWPRAKKTTQRRDDPSTAPGGSGNEQHMPR